MSILDKIKGVSRWSAPLLSAVAMYSTPLKANESVEETSPPPSITQTQNISSTKKSVEELEARVAKGQLVDGKTAAERRAYLQEQTKGLNTYEKLKFLKSQPSPKTVETAHKNKDGYVIQTWHSEDGRIDTVSYYPDGTLKARGTIGETLKAESFHPDGSRKMVRTKEGVETTYHPGGEKIKTTPHKVGEAYDVLDMQGRCLVHLHDFTKTKDFMGEITDQQQADYYDPETAELVATCQYTHAGSKYAWLKSVSLRNKDGVWEEQVSPEEDHIKCGGKDVSLKFLKWCFKELEDYNNELNREKATPQEDLNHGEKNQNDLASLKAMHSGGR